MNSQFPTVKTLEIKENTGKKKLKRIVIVADDRKSFKLASIFKILVQRRLRQGRDLKSISVIFQFPCHRNHKRIATFYN